MPLHPDLDAFLQMANANPAKLHELSVAEARASYDATSQLLGETYDESLPEFSIKTRDGHELTIRQYKDAAQLLVGKNSPAKKAILFFHGGGYVLGSLESHDALCRNIAKHTGFPVFAVNYRLAPEYTFPTAFYDACDAYQALVSAKASKKHSLADDADIVLMGDSVGATLAFNVCAQARDSGSHMPAKQILLYPCVSTKQDTASHNQFAQGYLLESDTLQWMFNHYLNDDSERDDWRFAPLVQADFTNLPATHVLLAEYDILVDEGKLLVEHLKKAGNTATLTIFEGMVHDFARFSSIVPEQVDALCQHITSLIGS